MPMQKMTTFLNKTDVEIEKQKPTELSEIHISEKILQNILQFAAAYRAQPVNKNQFVEMFLN